ncbi:putative endo-1,4-beta-xylanase [Medicago truncatula]|uniref:Putative endo-1,4-beta-xylanase n=1 Tax=Medicago truncatula TaxID=3880 RepID=A0A396IHK5_MEDTR|nr:putative endo-1,4-beta-xylanase [Medicago truncatula]
MKFLVSRYSGQLIAWDVVNENVHNRFFEDKLGKNASAVYYLTAYYLDSNTSMFMNVFNTIEFSQDQVASPANYIRNYWNAIGYMGARPFVKRHAKHCLHETMYFEEILREAYSHPAVEGIIMFVGPAQADFINTQLADANFKNTPTGDVVDKLIGEWGT